MRTTRCFAFVLGAPGLLFASTALAANDLGYYRMPTLHGDTIVFSAEGDLWRVSTDGGVAQRLTTHPDEETHPNFSPDGTMLVFNAAYEGPTEIYTMPLAGGAPMRRTYGADRAEAIGWTPDGASILYSTRAFSTLPDQQLALVDIATNTTTRVPLHQASDGAFGPDGEVLVFTRLPFQGSHTKRYKGGTAQQLWRYATGEAEATPLTTDYDGTSTAPMWWDGRVYFISDRDDTMNIWSMTPDGDDLRQHTMHAAFDVKEPSLHDGRIVYRRGADLWLYDIGANESRELDVTLASDFDQTRERWLLKPMEYLTSVHIAPDGSAAALTVRGEVFTVPVDPTRRRVRATRSTDVRYRNARWMPDGETLVAVSDESDELEFWTFPANGVGDRVQLTDDSTVFRNEPVVSPDGTHIAYTDNDWTLWIRDLNGNQTIRVAQSAADQIVDLAWSPDSQRLAFVFIESNTLGRIKVYDRADGSVTPVTSERVHSFSPQWTTDGAWMYFLSERDLTTSVASPWGRNQPDPHLHKTTRIYLAPLQGQTRSPFVTDDELDLADAKAKDEDEDDDDADGDEDNDDDAEAAGEADADGETDDETEDDAVERIEMDFSRAIDDLMIAPVPRGEYASLRVAKDRLLWLAANPDGPGATLQSLAIKRDAKPEVKTVIAGVSDLQLSGDRTHLLVRKGSGIHIAKVGADEKAIGKGALPLGGWKFAYDPREEWRQMFNDAWRMERDFFYDRDMHGVDWTAMRDKYAPLVDRVTTRGELSDILQQMVGELSTLHMYVFGGDFRDGPEQIAQGDLGARLERVADGWRVAQIYRGDRDRPDERSPLDRPKSRVDVGELITRVNGQPAADLPHFGMALRNTAGQPVLLHVRDGEGEERAVLVTPMSTRAASSLRYEHWVEERRLMVETEGDGELGYVHIRAMGQGNYAQWAEQYYPVFNRKGLILDVRHNSGGNIDSWILSKLMREIWMYWQGRNGDPTWNMQYAFPGHMVVLCDERTASDGEAFAEGFRRLGLGPVIGTRTWGGEIWLSFNTPLADRGMATAAEFGVYGPEGEWLIEGHGVDPDIVVDNLPVATFNGGDAQLMAAIRNLQARIDETPVVIPPPPDHPDLSIEENRGR